MKIELARHSGFCMGVRNAVMRVIKEINSQSGNIHVYGPLIHNPQTIDVLSRRGLITINSLEHIEDKILAVRTHGIPLQENRYIKDRAARVINLTCSRVSRVQAIIKKYSKMNFYTVIIGDNDHAEVTGLKSYASCGVTVVSGADDIDKIPGAEKYLIVAQTTLDRNQFNELVQKIGLKHQNLEIIDTICDSTRYRQEDVMEGVRRGIDALVVVGGKNSANTRRLAHMGVENNIVSSHIETAEDLDEEVFRNSKYVLVTAGASTPGWIINNVMEKLYNIKFRKGNLLIKGFKNILEFVVRSNLLSAIASFFLAMLVMEYTGMPRDLRIPAISFLYIFSMYSINNYLDREYLKDNNPYKYKIYNTYGFILLGLSIVFSVFSLLLSFALNRCAVIILLLSYLLGFAYSTEKSKRLIKKIGNTFILKMYNSKIITSFGWLVPIVIIPYVEFNASLIDISAVGLMLFSFIFLRHMLIDMIALQGDMIFGRETLPIWLGTGPVLVLVSVLSIVSISVFTVNTLSQKNPAFLVLASTLIYYLIAYLIITRLRYIISIKYEVLVDLNLIFIILLYLFIV